MSLDADNDAVTPSDHDRCGVTDCDRALRIRKPVPLCWKHIEDIGGWYIDTRFGGSLRVQQRSQAEEAERRAAETELRRANSVVYYIMFPGSLIKIGFSTDLPSRLTALTLVGPADVLATEPGGQPLEAVRHKQFVALRERRNEYFRAEKPLLDHVAMLRTHYGPPVVRRWNAA